MKTRFPISIAALSFAAGVVLWTTAQASAHRWHRGWAPYYGYSNSYYPIATWGPGFVYTPDYVALIANLAYSASYANHPYPFYRRPWH
jgi:uncharacterized membrane protein